MANERTRSVPRLNLLQRSPHVRSAAYLSLMAGVITISNEIMTRVDPSPYVNIHPPAFPVVLAATYAFAQLREQDAAAWKTAPSWGDVARLGSGFALGSTALLSVLGVAMAKGWIAAPAWGWDTVAPSVIGQSVVSLTFLEVLAVWNEEMVFRGYGLDTLRESLGRSGALVVSAALFAVYHGLDPRRLLSMLAFAVITTIQRTESGGLWMPVGFHLAWNLWQVAVFGPHDGPSSIRPLTTHGPADWVGEPGLPETGWLTAIVLGLLAAWMSLRFLRQRNR